jgi:NAD+ diphosphatase
LIDFTPAHHAPAGKGRKAGWFLFYQNKILIEPIGEQGIRPYFDDLAGFASVLLDSHYLGAMNGIDWYAAELADDGVVPQNVEFWGLRQLFGVVDDEMLWLAGHANHFIHWAGTHRFCGRCGAPTHEKSDERALFCEACGLVNYPRVSPAIIVAVLRDQRLLLARSTRIRTSFYSVLAGFVEPGETLEECVRREVREETGIAVANIRYFGSQPWPFPDSLMVAFTAEYAGGELALNPAEILDAGWFPATNLPPVPGKYSIARRLIDWFAENHG